MSDLAKFDKLLKEIYEPFALVPRRKKERGFLAESLLSFIRDAVRTAQKRQQRKDAAIARKFPPKYYEANKAIAKAILEGELAGEKDEDE